MIDKEQMVKMVGNVDPDKIDKDLLQGLDSDSSNTNDKRLDTCNNNTTGSKNKLYKTSWFNGRFLTAEAFKKQDIYWENKLKLLAQVHPPGISYGLGITENGYFIGDDKSVGKTIDSPFTLKSGVAFSSSGEPILVDRNFRFTIKNLLESYISKPTKVDRRKTHFSSCLCLEPDDSISQDIRGAYIIIINPCRSAEGEAKEYGSLCETDVSETCSTNGYQYGFKLSLCKYEVTAPDNNFHSEYSVQDKRGFYSAHYFDFFEHALDHRWDDGFLRDDRFCNVPQQEDCNIALAMVYINENNIEFLDQWIPRRVISTTQANKWAHTLLGAPSQAAAIARVNQFQCMLKESLELAPVPQTTPTIDVAEFSHEFPKAPQDQRNLIQLGFKHIPPFGFLPVDPTNDWYCEGMLNLRTVEANISTFFKGTNVIPYYAVALHDDDILEDINNVFYKDPVHIYQLANNNDDDDERKPHYVFPNNVEKIIEKFIGNMDDIINRDIEIVKMLIPMKGLNKRNVLYPSVDNINEDFNFRKLPGTSSVPRKFVVYVKQRLVLLDVIYQFLSLFNIIDNIGDSKTKQDKSLALLGCLDIYPNFDSNNNLRPMMAVFTKGFYITNSEMNEKKMAMFELDIESFKKASPNVNHNAARMIVLSNYAEDSVGFSRLENLIAILPEEVSVELLDMMIIEAKNNPSLIHEEPKLKMQIYRGKHAKYFSSDYQTVLWKAVTDELNEVKASEVLSTTNLHAVVKDINNQPIKVAETMFGDPDKLISYRNNMINKANSIEKEIHKLDAKQLPKEVGEKFNELLKKTKDTDIAFKKTQELFSGNQEVTEQLNIISDIADKAITKKPGNLLSKLFIK